MKLTIAALALVSLSASLASAGPPPEQALGPRMPALLKQYDVPSVSIAVIRNGALVWSAAYGEQSPGVPATTNTLYNIASMTKPITAEIVMRLASAGKLSLDEPMSAFWIDPDIKNDPRQRLLTPRLGLTHRTGFPNWRRETNKVLTFKFTPGSDSSYSGEGYEYVAKFVENKMREPFDAQAQRLVFAPLGMSQTAHRKRDWFKDRIALPFDGKFLDPDFADTWMASDLVYTTPADYAKLMIAVMNNEGVTPDLASQRSTTPQDFAPTVCKEGNLAGANCPTRLGFGLGWAVVNYPGETIIMHDGSDPGVKTQGFFVPERRFGLVVFTNGENGMKVIRDIVAQVYPGSPYAAFVAMQAH